MADIVLPVMDTVGRAMDAMPVWAKAGIGTAGDALAIVSGAGVGYTIAGVQQGHWEQKEYFEREQNNIILQQTKKQNRIYV